MALLRILRRVEDQSVVGKGPVDLIGHRLLPRTRAVRSRDAGAVAPIVAEELSTQLGGLRRAHSEASSGAGGIAGLEETQALVLTLRLPRSSRDTVKERERERERERRVQYAFRYSTG